MTSCAAVPTKNISRKAEFALDQSNYVGRLTSKLIFNLDRPAAAAQWLKSQRCQKFCCQDKMTKVQSEFQLPAPTCWTNHRHEIKHKLDYFFAKIGPFPSSFDTLFLSFGYS